MRSEMEVEKMRNKTRIILYHALCSPILTNYIHRPTFFPSRLWYIRFRNPLPNLPPDTHLPQKAGMKTWNM